MRVSASAMALVGAVAGVAAAVVAYQSAAGEAAAAHRSDTPPAVAPVVRTTWLPCEKGWKQDGQTCVRLKERVVVIHDHPRAAAPRVTVAGGSSPLVRSGGGVNRPSIRTAAPPTPTAVPREAEPEPESQVEPSDDGGPTSGTTGGD